MNLKTFVKPIAYANIMTALGIFLFWIGFYTEIIFPVAQLEPVIRNFAGYYAWETSFTIPDFIMAGLLIVGSILILRQHNEIIGKLLLLPAAGASVFLGVLDFIYAMNNGMYQLGHFYSYILMMIGIGLPILGTASIVTIIQTLAKSQGKC